MQNTATIFFSNGEVYRRKYSETIPHLQQKLCIGTKVFTDDPKNIKVIDAVTIE